MVKVIFSGEKLRELRNKKKYTQMKLAEAADTTDRYIRSLESGRKANPSALSLYRLSQCLECSVETFILTVPDPDDEI